MKHYGPEKQYEHQSSLLEMIGNNCTGIFYKMNCSSDIPQECVNFIKEQYTRFNIPLPEDVFIRAIAYAIFDHVDKTDPYMLFDYNGTDLVFSDDWNHKAIELVDSRSGQVTEANPEYCETFKLVPNNDAKNFEFLMQNLGIKHIGGNFCMLEEFLNGDMHGYDPIKDLMSDSDYEDFLVFCQTQETFDAYRDLAAWAAWAWLISPMARRWRESNCDIFYYAYKHGEVFLYEGMVVEYEYYKMVDRPPQSCIVCSTSAWCVELTYVMGESHYMCEKHSGNDEYSKTLFNCGSKICRYTECPNHQFHNMENARYLAASDRGHLGNKRERQQLIAQREEQRKLA